MPRISPLRLREMALFDDAINLVRQVGLEQLLFGMGESQV
jgi:hypothetical protein